MTHILKVVAMQRNMAIGYSGRKDTYWALEEELVKHDSAGEGQGTYGKRIE